MSDKIHAIATCPQNVRVLLQTELEQLGVDKTELGFRCVHFESDTKKFYEAHLKLRVASRIYRVIKVSPAQQMRYLYEKARRINWPNFFNSKQTYIVNGIAADRENKTVSSNEISKNIRLAIEDAFAHHKKPIPKVDLKEPDITIFAHLSEGRCTIGFDTSGKALHKRGYRVAGHPAPLKETLAASILLLMDYDGSQPFYDPMCGSGTLPIEAAYIALKKAPLIHRKKDEFDFEKLADFDKDLWRKIQDETRLERAEELAHPIFASDIKSEYVNMTRENALRARVEKHIQSSHQDFFDTKAPVPKGMMCINLPYGDRMEIEGLKKFYYDLGEKLKADYSGWTVGLFTDEKAPYKEIKLRPRKTIELLNGMIRTRLMISEID